MRDAHTAVPLLLVVGPHGAGKTHLLRRLAAREGYALYSLSPDLSHRLLEVPPAQRTHEVPRILRERIAAFPSGILLVDRIELLFAPALRLNPLRLLRELSRIRPLVVAWPGSYQDDVLTYAVQDHPEFRSYLRPEVYIYCIPEPAETPQRQTVFPPAGGKTDALRRPDPV